jgi:hypothetical protein
MAFVFTVESGTGTDAAANSYVSVEEATDIITANIHAATEWNMLTVPAQQRLLVWATRYLDAKARWKGTKTVPGSASYTNAFGTVVPAIAPSPLRWPRTGVCDRDGVTVGTASIPTQLRVATAEMARFQIAQDRTIERAQDGLQRVKADVVEIEFLPGYTLPSTPDFLQDLLTGLGSVPSSSMRFAPIVR